MSRYVVRFFLKMEVWIQVIRDIPGSRGVCLERLGLWRIKRYPKNVKMTKGIKYLHASNRRTVCFEQFWKIKPESCNVRFGLVGSFQMGSQWLICSNEIFVQGETSFWGSGSSFPPLGGLSSRALVFAKVAASLREHKCYLRYCTYRGDRSHNSSLTSSGITTLQHDYFYVSVWFSSDFSNFEHPELAVSLPKQLAPLPGRAPSRSPGAGAGARTLALWPVWLAQHGAPVVSMTLQSACGEKLVPKRPKKSCGWDEALGFCYWPFVGPGSQDQHLSLADRLKGCKQMRERWSAEGFFMLPKNLRRLSTGPAVMSWNELWDAVIWDFLVV